jgi:hypothetical protein
MKPENQGSQIAIYETQDGKARVEVRLKHDNAWLTQKRIAELFGVNVPAISKHLKNIFDSGELDENSVISKMETTAADGKKISNNIL